eukprot:jgi/Chrzof1/750/Cz01g27090.t1
MSALVRLHCFVSGRVQGVFFRACTTEKALALELVGWVRNRRDGRMEVTAEGNKHNLQELLAWLHKGPPESCVTGVEVEWQAATGEFSGFQKLPTL